MQVERIEEEAHVDGVPDSWAGVGVSVRGVRIAARFAEIRTERHRRREARLPGVSSPVVWLTKS